MELEFIVNEEEKTTVLADESLYMEVEEFALKIFTAEGIVNLIGVPSEIGKWIKRNKAMVTTWLETNSIDYSADFAEFKKAVRPLKGTKKEEKTAEEYQADLAVSIYNKEVKIEKILTTNDEIDEECFKEMDQLETEIKEGDFFQTTGPDNIKTLTTSEKIILIQTIAGDPSQNAKIRSLLFEINHWIKKGEYIYNLKRFKANKMEFGLEFQFVHRDLSYQLILTSSNFSVNIGETNGTKLIYFRTNDCRRV